MGWVVGRAVGEVTGAASGLGPRWEGLTQSRVRSFILS